MPRSFLGLTLSCIHFSRSEDLSHMDSNEHVLLMHRGIWAWPQLPISICEFVPKWWLVGCRSISLKPFFIPSTYYNVNSVLFRRAKRTPRGLLQLPSSNSYNGTCSYCSHNCIGMQAFFAFQHFLRDSEYLSNKCRRKKEGSFGFELLRVTTRYNIEKEGTLESERGWMTNRRDWTSKSDFPLLLLEVVLVELHHFWSITDKNIQHIHTQKSEKELFTSEIRGFRWGKESKRGRAWWWLLNNASSSIDLSQTGIST